MDDDKRHYTSSNLPTLESANSTNSEIEVLKELYSETNANYRNLADIRFKLLGFVPAVSIIAWAELLDKLKASTIAGCGLGLIITILGLRITYGIHIYDMRNDELYSDLISRGRKIEEEMGVHTGIFKGRLKGTSKDKIFKHVINHGRGLDLIYSSVFIGWGLLIVWYICSIIFLLMHK